MGTVLFVCSGFAQARFIELGTDREYFHVAVDRSGLPPADGDLLGGLA